MRRSSSARQIYRTSKIPVLPASLSTPAKESVSIGEAVNPEMRSTYLKFVRPPVMERPRVLTRVIEMFGELSGELREELYHMLVIRVQTIHAASVWQFSTYRPPG